MLATAAADRLSALGMLILRPGLSSCDGGALTHRHVALICLDDRDLRGATQWVLQLARASPRSHVVLDVTGSFRPSRGPMQPDERDIAAVDRHIDRLELDRAGARAGALTVSAALDSRDVAPEVRARVGAIRFWQGRFGETGDWAGGTTPDVCGWEALHAWARGDRAGRCTAMARMRPDGATTIAAAFWRRVHAVLTCLEQGRAAEAACAGLLNAAPGWLRPVAAAVVAEASRAGTRRVPALIVQPSGGQRLEGCLARWLSARADEGGEPAAVAEIRRYGAFGVLRWGGGRFSMQWLHVMPALLEVVRDAEDDLAALSGACRWLVRHASASRAVIVDDTGRRFLAGEGWTRAEWSRASGDVGSAFLRAPIRYRGEVIGQVVGAAGGVERQTLQPAIDTVAALLAPAVRARLDAISSTSRPREAHVPELIGRSPAIRAVRDEIARAAGVPFPVLVEGESGTGKELVARAVHRLGPRRERRFCAVNCAALSDELVEAELFGHARGAFTGAITPRPGLFEDAHGGTLFLDEVGELSPRAQAKLLRAVQEREVRRVGENAARSVDVRLVAATNVVLPEAVGAGRFRADLQFRLAVIRISLPPLRDRVEDIPLLAEAFWRQVTQAKSTRARLGPDALAGLSRHTWPGNVRELQNVIAALVMIAPGHGRVGARHVRQVLRASDTDAPWVSLTAARRTFEQRTVATALARHAGRRAAAARELGLSRQGLAKAIKRLGLAPETGDERTAGVA
jgi:DNA-binding NtrC family response regulator